MEMRIVTLESGERLDASALHRGAAVRDEQVAAAAKAIVDDVRERGDAALSEYTERFDHVKLNAFRVPDEMIGNAGDYLDEGVATALDKACDSISTFHMNRIPVSSFDMGDDGSMVGYRVSPLDAVGLYVPGGRAAYPSTVLMNGIPAKMAGVERLVMVTPPNADGTMDPALLYAAAIAGVDEVYAIGGAQAIAALAYGTETIEAVDKIVGPGNAYVAAAKRYVSGTVGIDLEAGPSEVLIIADDGARPAFVAADMMAQAEHDPDSAAYVVMVGDSILDDTLAEIARMSADSPRREIIERSLEANGAIFVCPDIDTAVGAANAIAPEHLQVMTRSPMEVVGRLRHAGAVFVGEWTPVPMGDYIAGPSHTLPTSGTARFSSPLTAEDFVKRTSIISYSPQAFAKRADAVMRLAEKEGFGMHARAVSERVSLLGGAADAAPEAPAVDDAAAPAGAAAVDAPAAADSVDDAADSGQRA